MAWRDGQRGFEEAFAALDFAALVRFAQKTADLPQYLWSWDLDRPAPMISRLANGKQLPTLRTLARFAAATGLIFRVEFEDERGLRESVFFDGAAHLRRAEDLTQADRLEREASRLRGKHLTPADGGPDGDGRPGEGRS